MENEDRRLVGVFDQLQKIELNLQIEVVRRLVEEQKIRVWASARVIATRCRSPPDNSVVRHAFLWVRLVACSASSTRRASSALSIAAYPRRNGSLPSATELRTGRGSPASSACATTATVIAMSCRVME